MRKVAIISGYFALGLAHPGHVDLINAGLWNGDILVVIVNNDFQTQQKYGFVPIPDHIRAEIIEGLPHKEHQDIISFISVDEDESVAKTLEKVVDSYKHSCPIKFSFINSGDRDSNNANLKELEVCNRLGIEILYLDMEKRGSSSELLGKVRNHYLEMENFGYE